MNNTIDPVTRAHHQPDASGFELTKNTMMKI